jgi:hypothetical protein
VAEVVSVAVDAALFGVFGWQGSVLENLEMATIPLGYFSAFTIAAMNFFFLGVVKKE